MMENIIMAVQDTEAVRDTRVAGPVEPISRLYLLLGRCFSYPEEVFSETMKDKRMEDEIKGMVKGLPFEMNFRGIPSTSQDEIESEYINTFDLGGGRTLYESAYTGHRDDMCSRDIYEDLLRFYEHFDIKLTDKEKDYPDNLVVELEFMAFLAEKEADSKGRGKPSYPYCLAQRDFLERHLNKWVHKLDERIQKRGKEPFYMGASAFMSEFIRNHLLYLKTLNKNMAV